MAENHKSSMNPENREQDSKKVIVIVVIAILLAINGLLLWQFFDKKSHLEEVNLALEATLSEKESLSAELQKVKVDYEKITQENATLNNQLAVKDEEIRTKISEIQRLINSGDAAQLKRAKVELETLRHLNQGYLSQIDSLNRSNSELMEKNTVLTTSLQDERGRLQNLMSENTLLANKVAIGSVLKTVQVQATGIRYRSSGKEVETSKASVVEKIKICFTVLENLVADKGTKGTYIRVLSPDGAVMSTSSETFMFNNQATLYTLRENFEYDNRDVDVCFHWAKGSVYVKGKYQIEIYVDGSLIGTTSLTMK